MIRTLASALAMLAAANAATPAFAQTMTTASPDMISSIDGVIRQDSRGWMFNHYDPGSVSNARFLEASADGSSGVAFADYTYNGGNHGWIKLRFASNSIQCIEYWDFSGTCRAVGSMSPAYATAGTVLAVAVVAAVAADAGGSHSSGRSSSSSSQSANTDPCFQYRNCNRNEPTPSYSPAPSIPPINPFYGEDHSAPPINPFYGDSH